MWTIINYVKNRCFTEKGQGIVEYALILVFVVALAAYLGASGGLGPAVKGAFDSVVTQLGG